MFDRFQVTALQVGLRDFIDILFPDKVSIFQSRIDFFNFFYLNFLNFFYF